MAELPEVQQSTSSKVSKTCKSPSMKLDMLFLRRLWRLIPVLFLSWRSAQALLFLLLLIVAGGEQGAAYYVGLIPSQFYIVLPAQDWYGFITTLWQSLLYIVLIALIKSTKTYISSLLYVKWRESLTTYLHRFYFKACNYYKLNVLQIGNIDNTSDQRICQDVERLCDRLNQVVPVMVVAPFTIITYTILTYKITGYLGPLVIYCYFITGSIINRFIMSPVIQLTYQREKWEGIFRFKHAQLRANSESVAFYSAGEAEKQNSDKKLFDMLAVQLRLANWKFWLQVAVNLFDYIGSILSYVIIAIPIFAGVYSDLPASEISSLISAYSFQTMYLISSFSKVIDLSNSITEIAGYTHRIGELMESLEDMTPDEDQEEVSKPSDLATSSLTTFPPYHPGDALPSNIPTDNQLLISEMERDREYMSEEAMVGEGEGATTAVEEEGGENGGVVDSVIAFHLEQVNVVAPSSKDILVEDLTLEISEGCSTLITGATGSGKTSLLRVLHGLWPVVSGRLERQGVGPRDVMFLPQKAYLTDGSLLEQIIYPDMISSRSRLPLDLDARVAKILDKVGLESLIQRCEGLNTTITWNWYDVLTPGEAQCLAFARLLFHKPKFALLDEATSAVPVDKEARLYSLCHAAKMTVVSVGHHVSLKRFHDRELCLDGQGGWSLMDITHIE